MFWRNERTKYGHVVKEKVRMYQCYFSINNPDKNVKYRLNMNCLVVCNTVEEAIAACRERWPDGFVLDQISKRNADCDLIVVDSALPLLES